MAFHISRSSQIFVEVAHEGLDGKIHGHSLEIQVFTHNDVDLDVWKEKIQNVCNRFNFGKLEDIIKGRTFEDVAVYVLNMMGRGADAVQVSLPSMGHQVLLYSDRA